MAAGTAGGSCAMEGYSCHGCLVVVSGGGGGGGEVW